MIRNPVLPGFCPDPSIIRVGDDYYIAVSTFEWWPGVRIYHSRDLRHFEQLPSPLCRQTQLKMEGNPDSCGVWAPDISYDGEYFWLIYTDVKTRNGNLYNTHNYLVWSRDISQGWSDPVYINSTGFDPSFFHDTDGKKYVVNMINGFRGVLVQEYDPKEQCLKGNAVNIYPGTGLPFTEGPHIYHIGEYYYLLMAEGGTAYEHCVTMARARSLWGPYEADPGNPVLTSRQDTLETLQKCGHGDLVQTQAGEWYLAHLCSRPAAGVKECVLGRETALQKVYWNEEGWLRLVQGGRYAFDSTPEPEGIEEQPFPSQRKERDDFDLPELDICYSSLRIPSESFADLSARPGYLRLYGRESLNSCFHVSLIAKRQTVHRCLAETEVEFVPSCMEQAAGMAYMYDTRNFYLLIKTGEEAVGFSEKDKKDRAVLKLLKSDRGEISCEKTVSVPLEGSLFLRIVTSEDGRSAEFFYSLDGREYVALRQERTNILTDEYCVGFTGAHFAMYCHDMTGRRAAADFDYFTYRERGEDE